MFVVRLPFIYYGRKHIKMLEQYVHDLGLLYLSQLNQFVNSMNGKELRTNPTLSPPKRDPQKSNIKPTSNLSQSDKSNKAVDIMRILSRKQQSRQSKINYQAYTYRINQQQQQSIRHSDYPSNFRISSFSINDDEEMYSTYANKPIVRNTHMFDQSFLSTNQSNSIIGMLLYILFIVFISIEALATAYVIPKQNSSNAFYYQTALLTILLSQLFYYLLMRYLNQHTKSRLFLHKSARASFDKLMHLSKTMMRPNQDEKTFASWLISKPYVLLATVVGTIVICQILYCKLVTQAIFLFQEKNVGYMVSTLFWSNFALPYLFSNFYLNRPIEDSNSKVKLFSIVVIVYILESFVEGLLFFSLIIFNICHTYVHSKKQFDIFHINQFIKFLLLCIVLVWIIIKYLYLSHEYLFHESVISFATTLLFHVVILTISMFLTRVIAFKYLKQQLYRNFYTQTGINMAFIITTFILNLMYLNEYHRKNSHLMIAVMINLVFLSILGAIIYLEGKDKLLVVINSDPCQVQNY